MTYTLKNVKSMQGREDMAFSCTIYKDGVRVGYGRNDGNGGMNHIDMEGADYAARHAAVCEFGRWTRENCSDSWIAAYVDDSDENNADLGLSMLFQRHEDAKAYKRQLRTKVLFRLPEDGDAAYRMMDHKGNPEGVTRWLRAKYPTAEVLDPTTLAWAS
jgi:hypothetical protein